MAPRKGSKLLRSPFSFKPEYHLVDALLLFGRSDFGILPQPFNECLQETITGKLQLAVFS